MAYGNSNNTNTQALTQNKGPENVEESSLSKPTIPEYTSSPINEEELIPSPIFGEIKFQKTIYSQTSFRQKINVSFNELNNVSEEVDIEGFFKKYRKIFYDIPKIGELSHTTLIDTSTDYRTDFINPKDIVIDSLNKQIILLQQQVNLLESGEGTEDTIGEILEVVDELDYKTVTIGDISNPFIYWADPDDNYYALLGTNLQNDSKYLSSNYNDVLPNGVELESSNNNQMEKDMLQSFEDRRNRQNKRTYDQWVEDIGKKSSGNRTTALIQLLDYHKDKLLNNFS